MFDRFTLPLAVLLACSVASIAGLQCYSCEGRESEMCGRNPTSARIVTCATNEMCNVLRTERTESFGGRTVTISRGCRQSAFAGAVAGSGVATTSQSCSVDLCNVGNGLGPSVGFGGQNDAVNFPGFPTFPQFPQFPTAGFDNSINNGGGFHQQTHSNNNQYRPGNSAPTSAVGALLWIPLLLAALSSVMYARI